MMKDEVKFEVHVSRPLTLAHNSSLITHHS